VSYNQSIQQLPDPNTTPVGPGWASQSILDTAPGQSNDLNGGSTVSVYQGGNYWTITLNYSAMPVDEYTNLGYFINSLKGKATKFYVSLPGKTHPKSGAWAVDTADRRGEGNITKVSANSIKVASEVLLGGELQVGDYLKLSDSDRIYYIIGVEYEDTSVIYTFHSLLEKTPNATTYLEPNDIKFKCVLKGDKPTETIGVSGLVEGFSLPLKSTVI